MAKATGKVETEQQLMQLLSSTPAPNQQQQQSQQASSPSEPGIFGRYLSTYRGGTSRFSEAFEPVLKWSPVIGVGCTALVVLTQQNRMSRRQIVFASLAYPVAITSTCILFGAITSAFGAFGSRFVAPARDIRENFTFGPEMAAKKREERWQQGER